MEEVGSLGDGSLFTKFSLKGCYIMSSSKNLKIQINDIVRKMERLKLQKALLEDRLRRKENHSDRVNLLNSNDQEAKNFHRSTISENIED